MGMEVGSAAWRRLLKEGLDALGVAADDGQVDCMALHGAELVKWNRKINLTAITDPAEMAVKHFVDSAAALPFVPPGARLLDIGSGGGFPGVPLKVLAPSLQVVLIDAVRKKVSFLQHLIRLLALGGIDARHVRAENLAAAGEAPFDAIVCRALMDVERFAALSLPLLGEKGRLIAFQGRGEGSRMMEGGLVGAGAGERLRVQRSDYLLPHGGFERSILILSRE